MMQRDALTVFTTVLVKNGKAQWLSEHLLRLAAHAKVLGISYPGDEILMQRMDSLINEGETHLLKITLGAHGFNCATRPLLPPSLADYAGARIIVTDVRVHKSLAKLKTNHLAPYQRAMTIAREHGAFEGLLVDDAGNVVDGSRSSPMLFTGDTLVSLEGGLKGITREKVLSQALSLGIRTSREKLKAHELNGLLLIAGTGIGLVPGGPTNDERILQLIQSLFLPGPSITLQ